jgi:redox-sensitive bicupin YhaK (pirin superfamily)
MSKTERIEARLADLGGGLLVRRALPTRQRRMVGAWCFLDHAGPMQFESGQGLNVGAHPHIGLQTFTWMIAGEVMHRDSLGNEQIIRPKQVNLMTAGRGIVHTEDSLAGENQLHAAQLWIALPAHLSDCAPAFDHYPNLPTWPHESCTLTLLAGSYGQYTAPTQLYSPMIGIDVQSAANSTIKLQLNPQFEYGILALEGDVQIGDEQYSIEEFAYLGSDLSAVELTLSAGSRILLLGGEPFAEPVLIWWNFVGFSKQAIAQAQREWEAGVSERFACVLSPDERRLVPPALPWRDI